MKPPSDDAKIERFLFLLKDRRLSRRTSSSGKSMVMARECVGNLLAATPITRLGVALVRFGQATKIDETHRPSALLCESLNGLF
jgi:hypothetical protein